MITFTVNFMNQTKRQIYSNGYDYSDILESNQSPFLEPPYRWMITDVENVGTQYAKLILADWSSEHGLLKNNSPNFTRRLVRRVQKDPLIG